MESKFKYYEIVKIKKTGFTIKNGLDGLHGVIIGKSIDEMGKWFYAVDILKIKDGWDLPEEFLESTGAFSSREDIYDGTTVRVKVDPKTGEGEALD